ncbi:hypothetical protein [Streptomyces sp. V3I7]|uniref:hypothetical protein n=1 Tax=Streptomyces sp. V3I7 TaxID=3042278 RepID=UPI0027891981|nr:hypothetical protein [Streptomyces sp. V3I7]MDQ0992596.1 hypothetical protein [Streptomyces sp. V3I7]
MSGGQRYWNEDTQRWEDGTGATGAAAAPTQPPPARPDFAPEVAPDAPPETAAPSGAWPGTGAWPPVEQPAAPTSAGGFTPARGLNRRLVWSVLVGAAAAGVAVSLVLTLVVGKGHDAPDDRKGTAGRSGSPTPTASTQEPVTSSPPAPGPTLPAGYESYDDKEGFRIAMPTGWKRGTTDSVYGMPVINYRSPNRDHRLQIYQVSEESPDASFELYLSGETPKPKGFEKLGLLNMDQGEFVGSRLEYLADSLRGEPDLGTWHVYDERFVGADGKIYAIAAYGADSDGRDDELELVTTALDWFCPPHTSCEGDPGQD